MKIKVNVTQRDIDRGKKKSNERCPIARALNRLKVFKDLLVDVGLIDVRVTGDGEERFIRLPLKAEDFIERYDKGLKVKPFSFTLEVDV